MPLPALPALPALPSLTPRSSVLGGRLASQLPPLTPEEEDSLLEHIWKGGLGVVSWLGEVLAKPARMVYALPSGKPRELLNIIPFSDSLGITDPTNMASPSAALENFGVLPENQEGLDWWDVPRFVADVVGDPLSHIGLGAKAAGAAGRAVQNAGLWKELPALTGATKRVSQIGTTINDLMPHLSQAQIDALHTAVGPTGKTLAEISDEPLRGLARASFMGMSSPNEMLLGTGPLAQKIAGQMDKYGSAIRYSKPIRVAASLLDTRSMGFVEPEFQKAAPSIFDKIQDRQAVARQETAQMVQHLGPLVNDPLSGDRIRALAEGLGRAGIHPAERQVATGLNTALDDAYKAVEAVGRDTGRLFTEGPHEAHLGYVPRQQTQIQGVTPLPTRFSAGQQKSLKLKKRLDLLRGLPGGTVGGDAPAWDVGGIQMSQAGFTPGVNQLLMDPRIRNVPLTRAGIQQGSKIIQEEFLDLPTSRPTVLAYAAQHNINPDTIAGQRTISRARYLTRNKAILSDDELAELKALNKSRSQSRKLIPLIQDLPEQNRDVPFFANHPLVDAANYKDKTIAVSTWSEGVSKVLGDTSEVPPATFADPLARQQYKNTTVSLARTLRNVGFTQGNKLHPQAADNMIAYLTNRGLIPAGTGHKDALEMLKTIRVPRRLYDDAVKSFQLFNDPKQLDAVRDGMARVTNLWKAGATATVRFNTRNVSTGMWSMYRDGMVDERFGKLDPRRYVQPLMDFHKLVNGKNLDDLINTPHFRGMTPDAATKKLQQMMHAHSIFGRGTLTQELAETIGMGGVNAANAVTPGQITRDTLRTLEEQIPGQLPAVPFAQQVKEAWKKPGSAKPHYVAGVKGAEDVFFPVWFFRKFGASAEAHMRGGSFIALLRKGIDPAEAARRVKTTHVDYQNLTRFEKRNLRTLAPFYTFHSRVMPQVLQHLLERPGGATRNAARLGDFLRGEEGVLPDRLTGSTAIPLGENEEGEQNYLTRLIDLPHESLNSMFQMTGPGALQNNLSSIGSFLHPVPKGLIELMTGHQLYDNQDLRDKDGRLGRIATTLGILDDPRQLPGRQLTETLANVVPYAGTLTSHLGTLLDDRKGPLTKAASLLTGAQTATVGARDKENALRQIIENELRGEPGVSVFESLYAPNPELLSPDEQLLLRLNKTITQRRQKARRAEAKAGSGSL